MRCALSCMLPIHVDTFVLKVAIVYLAHKKRKMQHSENKLIKKNPGSLGQFQPTQTFLPKKNQRFSTFNQLAGSIIAYRILSIPRGCF